MKKVMNSRGTILVENVVFIILNLIFLTILILFLFRQGDGIVVLEQSYAKEIAMLVDSSKPVMTMRLNMGKGFEIASEKGVSKEEIVTIKDNIVTVKLSEKTGYSYSFFNNVDVSVFPDKLSSSHYIILVNEYKQQEEISNE